MDVDPHRIAHGRRASETKVYVLILAWIEVENLAKIEIEPATGVSRSAGRKLLSWSSEGILG